MNLFITLNLSRDFINESMTLLINEEILELESEIEIDHRSYWILNILNVNRFLAMKMSRWLLLLKILMTQIEFVIENIMLVS